MFSVSGSAQQSRHSDAIATLAKEYNRPIPEVAEIYMRELTQLKAQARIEDYVELLTSKHVRGLLRDTTAQTAAQRPAQKDVEPA